MTNNNSFSSSVIDFTSPFHLTNNDNLSNILISHILEGENYPQWTRAMTTALRAKNNLSFVDDIAYSISYETTAQGMWDDLKDRFSRIFKLRRDLVIVSQGSSTISAYYTKLKSFLGRTCFLYPSATLFLWWPKCDYCDWVGHTIDTYYAIYGYPPGHRLHQPGKRTSSKPTINEKNTVAVNSSQSSSQFTQDQYRHLLSMLTEGNAQPMVNFAGNSTTSSSSIPLHTWIVDIGAFDQKIFDTSLFHSSTHISHITPIKLQNDSFALVTHIGYLFNTYTLLTSYIVCTFFWIQFTFHQQTYYIISLFSDMFS
ncbi:hypothetical protein AMTRI_Chr03g140400 [Amborella trichopoda]